MSTTPENDKTENVLDPFEAWQAARDASLKTMRSARDAGLEIWSKAMIDMVNSDTYSQATAQWLDGYLTVSQPFQDVIEKTMTRVLTSLNMPVRTEVTSLAERLTNIEMRLDDLDAKLDDIQRAVSALAPAKPAQQEARLDELNARLDEIKQAIAGLTPVKQTAKAKGADA